MRKLTLTVAAGLAAGITGSLVLGRLLGNLLFGVRAGDPATIGGVAGLLIFVSAAATYIPARRATRVDPAIERLIPIAALLPCRAAQPVVRPGNQLLGA